MQNRKQQKQAQNYLLLLDTVEPLNLCTAQGLHFAPFQAIKGPTTKF